jgi:hypothetical protein
LAAEIRPQLTARRRATNRRREEDEVKNEIVVYSETVEVGMMIVVTSLLQCAVKGAGPQREERPARELDRSTR